MAKDQTVDIGAYNMLRMRYVGVLRLLSDCSRHVHGELLDQIEMAMKDAVANGPVYNGHPLYRSHRSTSSVSFDVDFSGADR